MIITNELLEKRAIDLTADELASVIVEKLLQNEQAKKPISTRKLRGLKGIMEIFQCSKSKAQDLRRSGILDNAITPIGRSYLIDESIALKCVKGGR